MPVAPPIPSAAMYISEVQQTLTNITNNVSWENGSATAMGNNSLLETGRAAIYVHHLTRQDKTLLIVHGIIFLLALVGNGLVSRKCVFQAVLDVYSANTLQEENINWLILVANFANDKIARSKFSVCLHVYA